MTVSRKRITEYITKIAHSAQTSNYQVFFDGLSGELTKFLGSKEVDNRFIIEELVFVAVVLLFLVVLLPLQVLPVIIWVFKKKWYTPEFLPK